MIYQHRALLRGDGHPHSGNLEQPDDMTVLQHWDAVISVNAYQKLMQFWFPDHWFPQKTCKEILRALLGPYFQRHHLRMQHIPLWLGRAWRVLDLGAVAMNSYYNWSFPLEVLRQHHDVLVNTSVVGDAVTIEEWTMVQYIQPMSHPKLLRQFLRLVMHVDRRLYNMREAGIAPHTLHFRLSGQGEPIHVDVRTRDGNCVTITEGACL